MQKIPLVIVLAPHTIPSWNKIYQANNFSIRMRIAKQIHTEVREKLLEMGFRLYKHRLSYKVSIKIIGYFSKFPLDPDNIPAKLYIDGLKEYLLVNDTRRQIASVTTKSEIDKIRPRLEIHIFPIKEK